VRIVLDDRLQLSTKSQLVQTARETSLLVFSAADVDDSKAKELEANGVEIVRNDTHDLWSVLDELGHRSLLSVLVEGGAGVAGRFVEAGLVNKATFFIAPKIIGGREAPSAVGGKGVELLRDALKLEDIEVTQHGDDLEVTGYPRSGKE
jgi:diaminohydroxyphosphoribosylaminopyrimidine deaminase/5-amino-6-(5-phosphoribosylamino)uracil reductase